jgi:hypothetical protein
MTSPPNRTARPRRRLSRWLAAAFLVLLSAAVTFAVGEHLLLPRLPVLMLGKWIVVEGQYEGSTAELFRDGSMISTLWKNGGSEDIHGEVRVEGVKFWVTTRDRLAGKSTTEALTILDLSAEQFVTQDEAGNILVMKRVR